MSAFSDVPEHYIGFREPGNAEHDMYFNLVSSELNQTVNSHEDPIGWHDQANALIKQRYGWDLASFHEERMQYINAHPEMAAQIAANNPNMNDLQRQVAVYQEADKQLNATVGRDFYHLREDLITQYRTSLATQLGTNDPDVINPLADTRALIDASRIIKSAGPDGRISNTEYQAANPPSFDVKPLNLTDQQRIDMLDPITLKTNEYRRIVAPDVTLKIDYDKDPVAWNAAADDLAKQRYGFDAKALRKERNDYIANNTQEMESISEANADKGFVTQQLALYNAAESGLVATRGKDHLAARKEEIARYTQEMIEYSGTENDPASVRDPIVNNAAEWRAYGKPEKIVRPEPKPWIDPVPDPKPTSDPQRVDPVTPPDPTPDPQPTPDPTPKPAPQPTPDKEPKFVYIDGVRYQDDLTRAEFEQSLRGEKDVLSRPKNTDAYIKERADLLFTKGIGDSDQNGKLSALEQHNLIANKAAPVSLNTSNIAGEKAFLYERETSDYTGTHAGGDFKFTRIVDAHDLGMAAESANYYASTPYAGTKIETAADMSNRRANYTTTVLGTDNKPKIDPNMTYEKFQNEMVASGMSREQAIQATAFVFKYGDVTQPHNQLGNDISSEMKFSKNGYLSGVEQIAKIYGDGYNANHEQALAILNNKDKVITAKDLYTLTSLAHPEDAAKVKAGTYVIDTPIVVTEMNSTNYYGKNGVGGNVEQGNAPGSLTPGSGTPGGGSANTQAPASNAPQTARPSDGVAAAATGNTGLDIADEMMQLAASHRLFAGASQTLNRNATGVAQVNLSDGFSPTAGSANRNQDVERNV